MKRLLLLLLPFFGCLIANAQLLTWTPPFPKEADPAQTLVITMDASKGNQGLLNYTPTTDVYVHIGAITNRSNGGWVNVPFAWGSTTTAARATYIGNNKWTFTINGSLRSFFNVNSPDTVIQKIAILFRSGNGNLAQRNADGTDMFIPVYNNDLAVRIDNPPSEPKFIRTPENPNWSVGSNFSVTAHASRPSALKLYHNGTQIASVTNAQTITGNSTVTAIGNQRLIAEANDGTSVRYDTINIFVAPASAPVAALPAGVRDGINYEAGNTAATLVLRAPGKSLVTVIGDFNNWTPGAADIMNKTPDGKFFWLRLTGLQPGQEYAYQYVIDNSIKIADPYTEKILDPNNDPSIPASTYPGLRPYPAGQTGNVSILQTGVTPYNWAVPNFARPDKRGLVVYEMLVRDFVAAKNWKTVQDTLTYLKRLGINAIEIMPFNEFENRNSWGYDVSFYFAPDKEYGTSRALKEFIDSCHSKGIAVIMDIALNHSFGQSPMVQMYWDAANNRPAANNPWYNPTARHAFNVGYDMNHESADTRYFVSRVVEHWLKEYKIDGFRFDLSKGFTQVNTCDANGGNCNVGAWNAYDASRVAIWRQYYDTVQLKSPNSYVVLEHLSENQEERELADYGMLFWGHMNNNYSQAAKGNASGWDLSWAFHNIRGWTKPHLMAYAESHDEERIVYRAINEGSSSVNYNIRDTTTALKRAELTGAFLLMVPGPKLIWQFGELGYPYSINTCTNGTVNNNCRLDMKPIRWDYLNDARRVSVFNTYAQLNRLRFHPWYQHAFTTGTSDQNTSGPVKWIRVSSGDTSHALVVGNFDVNAQTGTITFPSTGVWYDYFNNTTVNSTGVAQSITLQPGEYRLFVNRNVNNVTGTPVSQVPPTANDLGAVVYPNPSTGAFTVDLQLPQASDVTVDLYNGTGQYLANLKRGLLPRGAQRISVPARGLARGSYYISIRSRWGVKTISVTIQ